MRLVVTACFCALMSSCTAYRFVKTDPSFTAVEKKELPQVYMTQPVPAFRSVGLIELEGTEETLPEELLAEAAGAGQKLGCEVVVSTALRAGRVLSRGVVLVHGEGHEAPSASDRGLGGSSDAPRGGVSRDMVRPKTFRFLCGLLVAAQGA